MPESLKPARALAIRLLEENRDEIGRGIYRLMCTVAPHYRAVDEDASAKNAGNLLKLYEGVLRSGDNAALVVFVEQMRAQRTAAGFTTGDLAVATHVYLPVIRKAFLARAPDLRAGVDAYDELEAVFLPLVIRWLRGLVDPLEDDATAKVPMVAITIDDAVPEFMLGNDDD